MKLKDYDFARKSIRFSVLLLWTIAFFLSFIRISFHYLDRQQEAISSWLSAELGRPIRLETITTTWNGWSPRIVADNFAILSTDLELDIVTFDQIMVDINVLSSIFSTAIKPSQLLVSGLDLKLKRDEQGKLSVAGMPTQNTSFLKWLAAQKKIFIIDSRLSITDSKLGTTYEFAKISLDLHDEDGNTRVKSVFLPPAELGAEILVDARFVGTPFGPDFDATIKFSARDMPTETLATLLNLDGDASKIFELTFSGITEWRKSELNHGNLLLIASNPLNGQNDFASSKLGFERELDGWTINLSDITSPIIEETNTERKIVLRYREADSNIKLYWKAQSLPIAPVLRMLERTRYFHFDELDKLARLSVGGEILKSSGVWATTKEGKPKWFTNIKIDGVSSASSGEIPGFSSLGGDIQADPTRALISFDVTDFKLSHEASLSKPIEVSEFSGKIEWTRGLSGTTLRTESLSGNAAGLNFRLAAGATQLTTPEQKVEIGIIFNSFKAERLKEIIPKGLFPGRGDTWARNLIEEGHISRGKFVFRGHPKSLSSNRGENFFKLIFDIGDATLRYSTRWPRATNVRGTVTINDNKTSFIVREGLIQGARIKAAKITMPETFIPRRRVEIVGKAQGAGQSIKEVIENSPLMNGRAARLTELNIGGNVLFNVDTTFPVHKLPLLRGEAQKLAGQLKLLGNRIGFKDSDLELENLKGDVIFGNSGWRGKALSGVYNGIPLQLTASGPGNPARDYDAIIEASGNLTTNAIDKLIEKHAISIHRQIDEGDGIPFMNGRSFWNAKLKIPHTTEGEIRQPYNLGIESDLSGISIDLPQPLGKHKNQKKPIFLGISFLPQTRPKESKQYTERRKDRATNLSDANRNTKVEVELGDSRIEIAAAGSYTATGAISSFKLTEWLPYLPKPSQKNTEADLSQLQFNVTVKEMDILGQNFLNTQVIGEKKYNDWVLELRNPKANGTVRIPNNFVGKPITLVFENLKLAKIDTSGIEKRETPTDPADFPPVTLTAKQFSYDGANLGHIDFKLNKNNHGLEIEKLHFSDKDFQIVAHGDWRLINGRNFSEFTVNASGKELKGLLARFNYEVDNVNKGKTEVKIRASWPGTPVEFNLAEMTGDFELLVGEGRLLDVEPGGGRLFGLLSLQSLPRRLSLDFDDLFKKGLAFDEIRGNFKIQDGDAYTDSLLLTGPSAQIDISGRTGLVAQDYDQYMVITPALSSSLPMAGALFGPIGMGAGAVVYLGQKMFKSIPDKIDNILKREYSIKGPWRNPTVERIKKNDAG